ncbi:MAG TPA: tetratricopeptide repeat protein [Polyangiaceae bacterium]|nr:tetratricopeptide repeat protein [Polyangiaceae bacterium]
MPFAEEAEPPSGALSGEEFLYHLSRGSELLKESQVQAAKEELEIALRLQPMDLRGQGLLGVVYFRLGLYPRAIDIYRQIVAAFSNEVTPKVNLALCYVKTGQHQSARELLEDVVQSDPNHQRAWAYLGLVFQFLHDFAKAEAAFERAGQHGMAARMRSMAAEADTLANDHPVPEMRWEIRAAAHDAFGEIETSAAPFRVDESAPRDQHSHGRWCATEPGEELVPLLDRYPRRRSSPPPEAAPHARPDSANAAIERRATPSSWRGELSARAPEEVTLRDWVDQRAPSTRGGQFAGVDARTVLIDLATPFAVRATAVVMLSPSELAKHELRMTRRTRTEEPGDPLGGGQAPIIGLKGPGRLIARAERGVIELFQLDDESIAVRHAELFGMSLELDYELVRIKLGSESLEVVQLRGRGTVVLNLPAAAKTIDVGAGGLLVRATELVGWTSRVLPSAVDPAEAPGRARGFVALHGEGAAILV